MSLFSRPSPRAPRTALLCLLAATGLLYAWGLGASGWANSFYSAAVQAGSHSWKAFFFGSSDAANFITVDKTPLALWPMDLAARVFGVNAWSILLPQALMGVATVGVLYATVRRSLVALSPRVAAGGGLLAGACLATTPVAALMFRFNNPDALLILLLTLGAYALVRAQERASTRWLVLAAAFVGLGFLAKMLQAFLVVPAFGLVYLVMAPTALRRRLWQLALALLTLLLSAGWWVAIVAAVPSGSRPYIGGSQHNSVLELALGYNGFGRLSGDETGGLGNTNQDAGWMRLFGLELGGQIAWLLPAALVLLVAGVWATWRLRTHPSNLYAPPAERALNASPLDPSSTAPRGARLAGVVPRTDAGLAGFALWGGWLVVTGAVFSLMQGIFHGYYTVALAPAVAALVGMGAAALWVQATAGLQARRGRVDHADRHVQGEDGWPALGAAEPRPRAAWADRRDGTGAAIVLAVVIVLTAWWSYRLLGRTSSFEPWLRVPILAGGLVAAGALLTGRWLTSRVPTDRVPTSRVPTDRLPTGHESADHESAGRRLMGWWSTGRVFAFGAGLAVVASLAGPAAYAIDTAATPHRGAIPSAGPSAGPGGMRGPGGFPGGMRGGFGGPPGGGARQGGMPQPPNGGFRPPGQNPGTGGAGPGGGGMRGGGMGGPGALLDASTPSAELTTLLKQNTGTYTWAAATVGSNTAAGYQLASGKPVMAIGGFNGTDPAPTLAGFQQYVRAGRIHYFLAGSMAGGRGGNSGGSDAAQQISAWVAQTFPARTVGGTTVYDLG